MSFVPDDFVVPSPPSSPSFRLEPLGPQHNESDYAAWTGSLDFIRALPGWEGSTWPYPMSLDDNEGDLRSHAAGYAARKEFTYTVLDPSSDVVIGCLYITPTRPPRDGATAVHSWVVADRAELDKTLYDAVSAWLASEWPFTDVEYAPR